VVFRSFDENKNGSVDIHEFRRGLAHRPGPPGAFRILKRP
jgi:Ca2+-binding EF-hand superfamily protein